MTRRSAALLAACLSAALLVPLSAQQTEIKLGTVAIAGTPWDLAIKQMGADLRTSTGGRVQLKPFAGTMGSDDAIVLKMKANQLQAASLTVVGLLNLDNAFNVFAVPLFYESYDELFHVMDALTPTLKARLEAKGLILLGWGLGGWVQVFSTEPIETLDDLKRARLYTSAGGQEAELTRQWYIRNGFNPQLIEPTEIFTGLQTGRITAVPLPPLVVLALRYYERARYMLDVKLGPMVGATVITTRAWNAIAEPDRAKVIEAARALDLRLREEIPRKDEEAVRVMEQSRAALKVSRVNGTPKGQTFYAKAAEFAATMRGTQVPEEIIDLAARERDAFRARRAPRK